MALDPTKRLCEMPQNAVFEDRHLENNQRYISPCSIDTQLLHSPTPRNNKEAQHIIPFPLFPAYLLLSQFLSVILSRCPVSGIGRCHN
mgnify:CR=1 FL=1